MAIADSDFEVVVTDDGSRTLFSPAYQQTFHSESGALSESKLVFIENSGLRQRLQAGQSTRVLEIGFGTGQNFCLSASIALQNSAVLHYHTVDHNFLPGKVIDHLQFSDSTELNTGFEWLQSWYPSIELLKVGQVFQVDRDGIDFQATCSPADALELESAIYDIVYLDAFSPENNAELWTAAFFKKLYSALQPDGRLVTYCVKSEIQRRLQSAGFDVRKTPGPVGGKREVLIAVKNSGG